MPSETTAHNEELVSVICRSIGRKELDQALQSLSHQSYPHIEVVLVDAAAVDMTAIPAKYPDLNIKIVNAGSPLKRSDAANAGLEAAAGTWISFLDEDDWIADHHISALLSTLHGQGDARAAYCSVQKTDVNGQPVDYRFEQDFDPVLLMRDNYIPIHAMLFHRSLLSEGCQFDPQFDIYEDWDFWLQLSEHTKFIHLDEFSAFYRQGGESDTELADAALRYQNDSENGKARAKLFTKWIRRWTGAQINSLLGTLDQSELISRITGDLDKEHQTNLAHQEQIGRLLKDLEAVRNHLARANRKIDIAQDRVGALESRINELLNSTSWKLTAPLRSLVSMVRGESGSQDKSKEDS